MNGQYKSSDRFRNFAFEIYPDSINTPNNWIQILKDLHIPIYISPLHDKDTWTEEDELKNSEHKKGTLKKAHYHILVTFEGKKSPMQVYKLVCEPVGGVCPFDNDFPEKSCIIVHSACHYGRYLCHMDDEDKHPYSPSEVLCLGGGNYYYLCSLPQDKVNDLSDVIDFINRNRVPSYAMLVNWFKAHDVKLYLTSLKYTNFLMVFIKSSVWSQSIIEESHYDEWK